MKYNKKYFILCAIAALCGMMAISLHNGWIMVRYPSPLTQANQYLNETASPKKTVTLYTWHHDRWQQEKTTLLWHTDKAEQIKYLINSWFSFLDEEKIIAKRVTVQTVLLTTTEQALISLDRSPFDKQCSVHEKMMLVESLLKTMRENHINIQRIQLLVHHAPLHDEHVDFNHAWPINGFIQTVINK